MYIISRKIAERKFDIRSSRKFRKFVSNKGYEPFIEELTKFLNLLDDLYIKVLRDHQDVTEILELMKNHKLLLNDALIAGTCRHHGVEKIATFDQDFERVDFLEVVKVE
ncbi:MAG TPA: PIN domain-containing protein [Candidatus Atribacteria bacterium]|nr:PIN domain-containing protein [Candidatus Atribacteria bacterium]